MCCKKLSEGAIAKFAELDAFIDGLGIDRNDERRRGRLIQVLHRAQAIFGYLPREVQLHVAEKLFLPEAVISGVVSFYNYFTTEPKGKYCIDVCLGTACYVKGSEKVLSEIEREAKEKGAYIMLTYASDWNIDFFKKQGYAIRGEFDDLPRGHRSFELMKTL